MLFYAVLLQQKAGSGVGLRISLLYTQAFLFKSFFQNLSPMSGRPPHYMAGKGEQKQNKRINYP